jgi:hypothetical protein
MVLIKTAGGIQGPYIPGVGAAWAGCGRVRRSVRSGSTTAAVLWEAVRVRVKVRRLEASMGGARRRLMRKQPWWCSRYVAASRLWNSVSCSFGGTSARGPYRLIKNRDIEATLAPR